MSKPHATKMPFESTTSVQDPYGDIGTARQGIQNMALLDPGIEHQQELDRRNITDSYGAYTGIPSAVLRKRLQDEAMNNLDYNRAMAIGQGRQAQVGDQLALANLTATRKQQGYNSAMNPGTLNSLIGGAASVGGQLLLGRGGGNGG